MLDVKKQRDEAALLIREVENAQKAYDALYRFLPRLTLTADEAAAFYARQDAEAKANPVKRGLVANPISWMWSSFLFYEAGVCGLVEIDPLG